MLVGADTKSFDSGVKYLYSDDKFWRFLGRFEIFPKNMCCEKPPKSIPG